MTFFRGLYIGQSRVGNHWNSERHSSEYRQIDYTHLVKLKLLLQSMQVLELFAGKADGILSFLNGHFLVRLMLKAKSIVLTRIFCEESAWGKPRKKTLLLALMVRSWVKVGNWKCNPAKGSVCQLQQQSTTNSSAKLLSELTNVIQTSLWQFWLGDTINDCR